MLVQLDQRRLEREQPALTHVVAGAQAESEQQAFDQGAVDGNGRPTVATQSKMNRDAVLAEKVERVAEMLDELVRWNERPEALGRYVELVTKLKIVTKEDAHGSSTSASRTRSKAICARLNPSAIASAEGLWKRQKLTSSSGM